MLLHGSRGDHKDGDNANANDNDRYLDAVEARLRRALWSFFAADALAMPSHWYYGGSRQIRQHYGPTGITDYVRPSLELPGSILNKSDLSGGGRRSFGGAGDSQTKTIIGDVICHGKQEFWHPSKQIHYHATLQAGENTLEAQLARVVMKSMVEAAAAHGGNDDDGQQHLFDADRFRNMYIDFMTTPGSHNDVYASTCHRMFFANLVYRKLPPDQCPDNDRHNVDTVDGLVLPTVVSLGVAANAAAVAASRDGDATTVEGRLEADQTWRNQVATAAVECASTTRNSRPLARAATAWGQLVGNAVLFGTVGEMPAYMAQQLGFRRMPSVQTKDSMTACYLDSAVPALLDNVVTHEHLRTSVWDALLVNANTGGENVHRGSCLGAVLGATSDEPELNPRLIEGLYDRAQLEREIDDFVDAVLLKKKRNQQQRDSELSVPAKGQEL